MFMPIKNYQKVNLIITIVVVLCIIVMILLLCFRSCGLYISRETNLGDIFTGLAFGATILMIWTQNRNIQRQQCESTFIIMINHLTDIANNIEFGQGWFRGKNVFKDCYNNLKQMWNLEKELNGQDGDPIVNAVEKVDFELLRSYFEYIVKIIEYIDRQKVLNKEEKNNYVKILKTQLSIYESAMLLYYYYYKKTDEKDKGIIKQYRLLDKLNENRIWLQAKHYEQYTNYQQPRNKAEEKE